MNNLNYTDSHDVDENETTVAVRGGMWTEDGGAGVTTQWMCDNPAHLAYYSFVASSIIVKCTSIIRISIMSTKI